MTNNNNNKKPDKPKPRGKYKVVFKGHLLPGFNKQQVVENIARLTKLPAEKIDQKFFSGKVVIIRRAHEQSYAQKLQQLFTDAGIEVVILKDESRQSDIASAASGADAEHPDKQAKKQRRSTVTGIKQLVIPLLIGILLIGGFGLWHKYSVTMAVPEEVTAIENSLASKKLLFLAHINVQQLLAQQDLISNDMSSLAGLYAGWIKQLNGAGIEPKDSLKQIVSAVYADKQQLVSQTVLLGNFAPDKVKKFLVQNYHAQILPGAKGMHLRISRINQQSCKPENLLEVSIEAQRILISTRGYLQELQQLLSDKPGMLTDLSLWRSYQQNKLLSLALFVPPADTGLQSVDLSDSFPQAVLPLMMAKGLLRKNASVDSLFAGVALQWLPPSALLDVTLNSRDQNWLNQSHTELLKQLQNMQDKSNGLIHLQSLLNKLSVQKKIPDNSGSTAPGNGQLVLSLTLDRAFKKSLELSVRELLAKFFTLETDSSFAGRAQQLAAESLDDRPLKFKKQYAVEQLPAFDAALDKFFKPAWVDGPFALAIDELSLESYADGEQVVLQLRGKAQNIENVGDKQLKLKITAAADQQGNNLLAAANCGQSAVTGYFNSLGGQRTAYIDNQAIAYNELEVRRKVKLQKGIRFSQVVSLSGEIELNLATRTESLAFAKTSDNLLVNENSSSILFKPSAKDTLAYSLSGEHYKVLVVRALNSKKQYLKRISRSTMANLLHDGYAVTQKYQGEIAYIEVVYAVQLETLSYPFVINEFPPYPTDNQWQYAHEAVTLSSLAKWQKNYQTMKPLNLTSEHNWNGDMQAQWHDGPLNVALFGLNTSKYWGTKGLLVIKTPLIDELRHNLSALEVVIHDPQAGDIKTEHSYFYQLRANGYYMNGDFIVDKDKPWLAGQLSFTLPYKNAAEPLREITGDILIHLPLSMYKRSFSDMNIGAQWQDQGLTAKIVRLGNEVMEFAVSGNRDRLLQIILLDNKNQRISTTDIRSGMGMSSTEGNIIVNYHGIPKKAVLILSAGQQIRRYPFVLEVKESKLQEKN